MSDPLFCDYRGCNLDVHDYARLLQRAAQGHVLWEPSTVGAVGDCGQIRHGQFWKYFNVYEDPPPGLPRLTLENAERDIRTTAIDNQDVIRSAETISVSVHGGLPLTRLSINGSFSWDRAEFAFLVFGGRTRLSEKVSPLKSEELQRYLVQYEKQIRLALGALSGDIVILHAVTRAPAWMGGVARRTSFEAKSALAMDVGGINLDWGVSVARNRGKSFTMPLSPAASCAITRGPAGWDGTLDPAVLSTVVVRPIRVKRRQKILAQLLSLLKTYPGAECEKSGMTTALASLQLTKPEPHPTIAEICAGTYSNVDVDSSSTSGSSNSDLDMEGDLLDAILQDFLDANPSVDVVTGSWDMITDFVTVYGDARLDPAGVCPEFKYDVDCPDVAFIVSLSPRLSDRPGSTTPDFAEWSNTAESRISAGPRDGSWFNGVSRPAPDLAARQRALLFTKRAHGSDPKAVARGNHGPSASHGSSTPTGRRHQSQTYASSQKSAHPERVRAPAPAYATWRAHGEQGSCMPPLGRDNPSDPWCGQSDSD